MKCSTLKALLLVTSTTIALSTNGQSLNKFSLSTNVGYGFLYGELTEKAGTSSRANASFDGSISYHPNDSWRFTAQLTNGIFSGRSSLASFESSFIEPSLLAGYNLMPLFNKKSKFRLEAEIGLGWLGFYGSRYNVGQTMLQAKIPNEGVLSNSPVGLLGGKLGYAINEKMDIQLGYTQRHIHDNDYFDGYSGGEGGDHFGLATAGVVFYLKSDVKSDEMKVKKKEYETVVAENTQLKDEVELAMEEKQAQLKAKDQQIAELQSKVDSMESLPAVVNAKDAATRERLEAENGGVIKEQYRVVVGSFSKLENAQEYVSERFPNDGDDIKIVYVKDMKMYRVIYRSYDSYYDAKRDIDKLKGKVKGLWIVRF